MHEFESGFRCYDNFSARGRKPVEHHLPNLLNDIKDIVDAESQTDPTFKTTRLYVRWSAVEVRKQLIKQKGYSDEELPTTETIRSKLNQLGYHPKKVKKVNPRKRYPRRMLFLSRWRRSMPPLTLMRRSCGCRLTPKGLFCWRFCREAASIG
ncbi:MAG: hypothetical protein GY833_19635 [Aestuariibacter sp.]|nr:hypothetical protein [Aestuariibacter sp.]